MADLESISSDAGTARHLPLIGIPPVPARKLTVDEYHRMIDAGVLREDDPFELLDGWLVPKMTRKPPHDVSLELVEEVLRQLLPSGWRARSQKALSIADSEPEPDVAVVRGPIRSHAGRHPTASETCLVIEVADASLREDRTLKSVIYARANIPIYWIVNLVDLQVEVYTEPTGPVAAPCYAPRTDYLATDEVPLVIDGREVARIPVKDLLP